MHMSSQRYINSASEYKYICILIYNTFCSATFYNDPPMITHAVAQELGPQEVNSSASAPPNATKIAVKKGSDVVVCMFGPEL